jgi:hypothetical protein
MKTMRAEIAKRFFFVALLVVIMTCLKCVSVMAAQEITVPEGVYRVKAINGNSSGQYLTYSKDSNRDKKLQFHSLVDFEYIDPELLFNNPDYELDQLWLIQRTPANDNSYYIWEYESYCTGGSNMRLFKVKKPNGDTPVYCETGADNGPDYYTSFKFYRESGSTAYSNLTIRPAGFENYRLNRHKEVRVFDSDIIYVNANNDNDTANKLWKLEPFAELEARYEDPNGKYLYSENFLLDGRWKIASYVPPLGEDQGFFGWHLYGGGNTLYQSGQEMPPSKYGVTLIADIRTVPTTVNTKAAAPSLSAKKNGKVTITWDEFRSKMKKKSFWKKAKLIEVQYSTNKNFKKNTKTKTIKKGTINKKSAKTKLTKLKRGKTYYVRVRLWDGVSKYSKWSKTVKVKTK